MLSADRNGLVSRLIALTALACAAMICGPHLLAEEIPGVAVESAERLSVEALAARVRSSLVVVRSKDRTGGDLGLGTGFVISEDGLIVTARHVFGDGRDIAVELPDGKVVPVTEVHASSAHVDLAILRVTSTGLQALPISNDDEIAQGREVVAMGHPKGLRNSVFSGVVSGHQEIDGLKMLQLAMPIEQGLSGGPVVDRQGRVVGVVTMKSIVAENIGFALPVPLLRVLIAEPNPVPISRWRTIGALDSRQWQPLFGADWRQRAGRVTVNGAGNSFGGRTLCLRQPDLPDRPFDLRVSVKLGDEQGAAGLVFHSDGHDRHYGFYPSAGHLRLTRFDGPDVGSWTILHNEPHAAYKPGEWNTLLVRVHPDHFECFVNHELVVESRDDILPAGQVGIAAFRGTDAVFRRFDADRKLLPESNDRQIRENLRKIVDAAAGDAPGANEVLQQLVPLGDQASEFLVAEARLLDQKAEHLRQLSRDLYETRIRRELATALGIAEEPAAKPETSGDVPISAEPSLPACDLLRAALLIARIDNADVDVDSYVTQVDQMADEIKASLAEHSSPAARLARLDQYLFEELGVRGSRFDEYYTRSNSYLNEVIDDREGLPVTLSVLYIELAERLELNVTGVGLPGHFVVRYQPDDLLLAAELIDPFEKGRRLSAQDVESLMAASGFPDLPQFQESKTPRQIAERMTLNLLSLAENTRKDTDVLSCLETLVLLAPENSEYRAKRLELRARTGRLQLAIDDADWFIKMQPEAVDPDRLRELRKSLEEQIERRNPGR